MAEWKDIKDAPRDGTEILGYIMGDFVTGYEVMKWRRDKWTAKNKAYYYDEDKILGWQPLPEPPKKKHFCMNPSTNSVFPYCEIVGSDLSLRINDSSYIVKYCPFCGEAADGGKG